MRLMTFTHQVSDGLPQLPDFLLQVQVPLCQHLHHLLRPQSCIHLKRSIRKKSLLLVSMASPQISSEHINREIVVTVKHRPVPSARRWSSLPLTSPPAVFPSGSSECPAPRSSSPSASATSHVPAFPMKTGHAS